jgi:hypothetical protein
MRLKTIFTFLFPLMSTDRTRRIDLDHVFSKPREHHPVYNKDERDILDSFKDRYLAHTSSSSKKTFAQNTMFPELFDYWETQGFNYSVKQALEKANVSS